MLFKVASLLAIGALATMPHDPLPDLEIGTSLPASDIRMKDVSGKELSLKDAAGTNGLLVIFSCNTCPFVIGNEDSQGWEGRYPELAAYTQRHGVGIIFVNSNTAKRENGDGFADMQARYKEKKYAGHYVLDEGNKVADAFGARTTPHVFLFDKDLKLAYKGAIDDNVGDASAVKERYVEKAVANVAAGKSADPAVTRNIGCSIKRVAVEHKH
ncbi:MAG: redoxin domain-containing protein [Flavobacteriales bacterium]